MESKYCRNEDYSDDVLLDYCMELLGVTREELVEKYNNRYSYDKFRLYKRTVSKIER